MRAADGTTCRTAVGGNGAYVDMGVIGNPERTGESEGSVSAYGRLVVPLGAMNRKRVDCTRLYDLEVARLEMELKLMQMGLGRGMAPVGSSSADSGTPLDGNTTAGTPPIPDTNDKEIKIAKLEQNNTVKESGDDWDEDGWSTDGLKKKKK